MKKFLCFILAGFIAASAFAGNVKITLNGNKNFVVMIDGRTYTANTTSAGKKEILINDLQNGQHTIEIFRPNARGVNKEIYQSSFDLSQNESIHITVNGNGGVKIEETTNSNAYGDYRTQMTDASFNQLYKNINAKRGQAAKLTSAKEAFNSSTNYFTVAQTSDVIRLINAESSRLLLAKLALDNLTDQANYADLHELFDLQSSIDDFDNYVRNNTVYAESNNNTYRVPMSDANYNSVYENIRKKWLPGGKMIAASEAFNNTSYNFTTAQTRKIIALLSSEANRLELAKLSFDNITDQSNFRQLYDLFTTKASKDELDEFVRVNGTTSY
jgi:hypothetical protein